MDLHSPDFNKETDPDNKRLIGTVAYNNRPFDLPYISKIENNLFIGGCIDGLILPSNIEHLVSLYSLEGYKINHEIKSALYSPFDDSLQKPDYRLIKSLAFWVNAKQQSGETLVHCQVGLNRSALIIATALIFKGLSPDIAITLLREKRSPLVLCNPVFENWLLNELPNYINKDRDISLNKI